MPPSAAAAVGVGALRKDAHDAHTQKRAQGDERFASGNAAARISDLVRRDRAYLEQRLAALEAQSVLESADAGAPVASAGPALPTEEELDRQVQATRVRHAEWRTVHASEARDGWSTEQESVFKAELQKGSKTGSFTVVGIDCRMTWCRADLEWPSFGAAQAGYPQALHVVVPGCESAILLDEPTDTARPYRAIAMYNCESARSGDSE